MSNQQAANTMYEASSSMYEASDRFFIGVQFLAELEMMKAANKEKEIKGLPQAYKEDDFARLHQTMIETR